MPSGSVNAEKIHCPKGHLYDLENTYVAKTGNRHCRCCHKEKAKVEYQVKPDTLKSRVYGRKADYRRRVNMLKTSCATCQETAVECLDFHHTDSTQKFHSVSWLVSNGRPWNLIEAETAKCIVLCSNCHRKLEAQKRKEKHKWNM